MPGFKPQVASRNRSRKFRGAIGIALVSLTSLALTTACHGARGGTGTSMKLEREVFVAQFGGSARAILPRPDGGVLVVGGAGSAIALALGPDNQPQWRFQEPIDPAIKESNQSIYNGAVALANGNILLCGETLTDKTGMGLVTVLDSEGKVVDERHVVANDAREFFFSSFRQCLPWNGGILLLGEATNDSGAHTWLMTLDSSGKLTSQHLRPEIHATAVVPSADGGLIFAADTPVSHQTELVRVDRQLAIVGRRAIDSTAFGLLRPLPGATATKLIIYREKQQASLYTLGEQLEDVHPPHALDTITISKGCGVTLADGSLALFGYVYRGGPYTAAMARIDAAGAPVTTYTFTPELSSFTVADAQPVSNDEFVAVRDSTPRKPGDAAGIVVFRVALH